MDVLLQTPLDFAQSDPETTRRKVQLLSAVADYFNTLALAEYGGRVGAERQPGLVEQVVAAAFQTFAGRDSHPSPFEKAAMLVRGITQGHPFQDANKRMGFLVASYYLAQLGYELVDPVPEAELIALAVGVSAGQVRDVAEIAAALRPFYRPHSGPEGTSGTA
ncbi:MAG TPA: type II toxin-antitoxin system death-on-curing family toxin [Thermomicrobiales bacterium]|nr:type II toxin-antitoxin system death-on-curing family toxin [Thermomicrobiales bacterium]